MDIAYRCWADPDLTVVGVYLLDGGHTGAAASAAARSAQLLPSSDGASVVTLVMPGGGDGEAAAGNVDDDEIMGDAPAPPATLAAPIDLDMD